MKVLVFGSWISRHKGGSEVRAECIVGALAKAGIAVDFVAAHPSNAFSVVTIDRMRVFYIGSKFTRFHTLMQCWPSKDVNFLQFAELFVSSLILVAMLASKSHYDAIITLNAHFLSVVAEIISRRRRIPLVIDQTQDSIEKTHNPFTVANATRMLRRADVITTSSEYYVKYLASRFGSQLLSKTVVITNWVDSKFFSPGEPTHFSKFEIAKPVILSMGRVDTFPSYIRLSRELTNLGFDHTIIVLGKVVPKVPIKLIANEALHNFVFLGYVPDEALPDVIRIADFCPVFYEQDMLCPPAKIIQLMSTGKVIVSRWFPGIEGILSKDCAILLDATANERDYAKAIVKSYQRKRYLEQIGFRARAKAVNEFSIQRAAEKLDEMLRKITQ